MKSLVAASLLVLAGTAVTASDVPVGMQQTGQRSSAGCPAGRSSCRVGAVRRAGDTVFLPASMTKAMTTLIVFDLIASGELGEDPLLPTSVNRLVRKGDHVVPRPGAEEQFGTY